MSKEIIVERGTKTVYREGSKIIKQFKAPRAPSSKRRLTTLWRKNPA